MSRRPISKVSAVLSNVCLLAAALLVGCSQDSTSEPQKTTPSTGSVAVIDLDRVAQQLGQDKRITQTLTASQTNLQQQLTKLAQNYQQQITQKKQAAEGATTGDNAIQLASFQREASAKLNEARQQVTRDLASQRSQLIASFRQQIKPYAREAARARGLSVIVTNNDSVIYDYVASVDITDDVVKAITSRQQNAPTASKFPGSN
ncbi:MAG: OmpH family outer membrane protein [Lacipirellulaceae bacterium]